MPLGCSPGGNDSGGRFMRLLCEANAILTWIAANVV